MATITPSSLTCKILSRSGQLQHTLIACFRGTRVACHFGYGVLLAVIFPLFGKPAQQQIVKRWSRKLLEMLNVGMETCGCHPIAAQGRMLVANHASWLDVIAMNAALPAYFVAKSEVGNWPLLGWISRRAHTLFIERGNRLDTARINRQIEGLLGLGECIAVFPEGTTTERGRPGHFHSSLLQAPIAAGAAICPIAIHYHDGAGSASSDAAFVGDMSFARSLWNILRSPSLHATLVYLPPLQSSGKNRRTLASEAQAVIHAALDQLSPGNMHPSSGTAIAPTWHTATLSVPRAHFINF